MKQKWIEQEQARAETALDAQGATITKGDKGREVRACSLYGGPELRLEDSDDGPGRLVGYAAVFDKLSVRLAWGFREKIAPGAFADSLGRGDDVRALVEHQGGLLTLGRNTADTLRLAEDKKGLRVEMDLPDTTAGRDIKVLVERGDLHQMSFGFRVPTGGDEWSEDEDQNEERTVTKADLFDVSVVAFPAYEDTEVLARACNFDIALRSRDVWVGARCVSPKKLREQLKAAHLWTLRHPGS
jgi:HK97 family phage prohead protease